MTKFNYLLDQMKSAHVKGVLTILQTAKSKYIQVESFLFACVVLIVHLAMEKSRYQNHRCCQ